MGELSAMHWLIFVLGFCNIAMIAHIAISNRISGAIKAAWVVAALLIPIIPYFIWLLTRPSEKIANARESVRLAQARALVAEAEAREAEARSKAIKANQSHMEDIRSPPSIPTTKPFFEEPKHAVATRTDDELPLQLADQLSAGQTSLIVVAIINELQRRGYDLDAIRLVVSDRLGPEGDHLIDQHVRPNLGT